MPFHNHLVHEMALPPYAEQQLGESAAVLRTMAAGSDEAVGKVSGGGGGGPSWLSSAVLRQQGHPYGADRSFLHLQTASDSSASPSAVSQWLPRPQMRGPDEENPVSGESMIAAAMSHGGRGGGSSGQGGGAAEVTAVGEGTWQNARYKAEILAHPLYEQLLAAHVACLRIATPVDQLPRIDAQLAQSQHVVAKYSVLGAAVNPDDKELNQFMTHYVLLLCSFKEQLQQHVRVHAMEAVMACWELEQSLQSLTGVSPGEGTGATMSDDDDDDQADSDTNLFDESFDGPDSMGFGPLLPTESERSLMERVRQELKNELKQGYKNKIVDIREEILRKRRAGKLPGGTTSLLKSWWQSHSKWPYPTEDDKARLVQETGLQLKQINNWFINQRKRNWHSNPASTTALKSKRKR
ncbi:homeobox protein knotted-1-like 7 isoform X2 [Elaeis guineensis]|uniref:Homeobox protein knotted-1-like 13 isoform X2 n=1 Tax=Elaeis guineensis var. tenera TaxID=51953 RepID=A0A6I9SES9_ELAGV|nr:homeobox protein knotted-1-like 13 isoform X2 [Elaeis guineensis]